MFLRDVSLTFVAGVVGGLANSLALWLCGALGVTRFFGVALAPAFTGPWLYPRLVWGGIWGWLFLLPTPKLTYPTRGLFLSLGPTLVQLLVVFPELGKGLLGLQLGYLTPAFVVIFNAIWGLVAAVWLKYARSS
jgi:phage shock protein PspC (stress-responsive transcriptional regulator)